MSLIYDITALTPAQLRALADALELAEASRPVSDEVPLDRKLLLSVDDITKLTPLSDSSIRRYIRKGDLRKVAGTERVVIARWELDRFLREQTETAS